MGTHENIHNSISPIQTLKVHQTAPQETPTAANSNVRMQPTRGIIGKEGAALLSPTFTQTAPLSPYSMPLFHCPTTHQLPHVTQRFYFRGRPEVSPPSRLGPAPWGRPTQGLLLDRSTFRPMPVCCKTSGPLEATPPECWSRSTPLPLRTASGRRWYGKQVRTGTVSSFKSQLSCFKLQER